MTIPIRILRALADDLVRPPEHNARQRDRHARILAVAEAAFATHGRHNIVFTKLAAALRIAPATLRYHFADLDALLGEILVRHLQFLATQLGCVPHDAADRQKCLRSAYLAATRTGFGSFTPAHTLLIRDRHTLPEDLSLNIELTRDSLGEILAGPLADKALTLLDSPSFDAPNIETTLASLMLEKQPAESMAQPPPSETPAPAWLTAIAPQAPRALRHEATPQNLIWKGPSKTPFIGSAPRAHPPPG